MPYDRIVISSGHGKFVRGACGILDEVDEARRVVDAVASIMRDRGAEVDVYHDDWSTSQNENLNRIVDHHNSKTRDLDVSVHFNAFEQVSKPMGCEVLYVTQSVLAGQVSAAIADVAGWPDRGAKKRTDLFFLNSTEMPSILLEVCFVDSESDAEVYVEQFVAICEAIAYAISGLEDMTEPPPTGELVPPPATIPRIDIEVSGEVLIFVNGEQVGTKG